MFFNKDVYMRWFSKFVVMIVVATHVNAQDKLLTTTGPIIKAEQRHDISCVSVVTTGGSGSGTVVLRDGDKAVILTNKHVVLDEDKKVEDKLWVLKDGKRYNATVIKVHEKSDIALVSATISLPAVTIATVKPLKGDKIRHFGKATGPQEGTVDGWTEFVYEGMAMNSLIFSVPGDSGAGIFNEKGQLVGVHFGRRGRPKDDDPIAFSVSLEVVRKFLAVDK